MREILLALCAILAVSTARVVINAEDKPHMFGVDQCTWGPSYWCTNITTSAGCSATKHCIKTVWEKLEVPDDNDSVCSICKDMVQQARDQLESQQTQEDLKTVFEGSCKLIIVKPVIKECIKIVDQFIPELVETLASQMNPSVVCTVAGLCNSAHIDQLLLEHQKLGAEVEQIKSMSLKDDELEPDECSKCITVATHMENKLKNTPNNKLATQFLRVCGEMGSFSDACSSIVLTNFDTIYSHLQENFKANSICHLSGQCSSKFHQHEDDNGKALKVEIRPLSSVGMVEIGDDLPCKLCEQLVGHLRDLLVANTTEAEFQQVLEGLCKQTKSFAAECKSIVDEYYPEIYTYLTKGLNTNVVCQMSGLCPAPGNVESSPLWPLLPQDQGEIGVRILKDNERNTETEHKNLEADEMQLPIERMRLPFGLGEPEMDVKGQEACAFCEYLLHYVQQAITTPTTEEKVKKIIGEVCHKLPKFVENNCEEFVNTYGDAVVAILVQEIDPSQVCPMIHVCPTTEFMDLWEQLPKEMMLKSEVEEKPNCPLCLLAVTQIYHRILNNKTEANIEAELDKLCSHLPNGVLDQCVDFVKGYSKELIELLLADLTPQEICVYIKFCDPDSDPGPRENFFPTDKNGEIMTNEIPNFPLYTTKREDVKDDPMCVVCEFVMQYVEKEMRNKKTKDDIERMIHGVCNHLPRTVSKKCNQFIDEYADIVIDLLSQEVSPKEICTMIGLCLTSIQQMEESVAECALCQTIISTVDKLLGNPQIDEDIEHAVSKVCKYLPASKYNKCTMMVEVYGQSIINLFRDHADSKQICSKMALCSENDYFVMSMKRQRRSTTKAVGTKPCTWGPSYWCMNDENANECKAVEHCRQNIWKAESAAAAAQQNAATSLK